MATKVVKILDKNFHISLKLNDLQISVAVGLYVRLQLDCNVYLERVAEFH